MRSALLRRPPNVADLTPRSRATETSAVQPVPDSEHAPLLWVARLTTLATLSYAAWRFGATDATAWLHVAVGLSIAVGLCLVSLAVHRWRPALPPLVIGILPLAFLTYSVLQLVPLPPTIASTFFEAGEIHRDFGTGSTEPVFIAAWKLTSEIPVLSPAAFPSVIPQRTKAALIPWMLAAAACLISSVLFTTSKSRRMFLWCILLHTAALAIWGIIQRSNGALEILPSIPHTSRGLPFSSFVYRNAGAAAILPGLAAAAALLSLSLSRSDRAQSGSSHQRLRLGSVYTERQYANFRGMLSVRELVLISLGCAVLVGVIASLSRGAWVAGAFSLLVAALVLRGSFRLGRGFMVLAIGVAIMSVATAQITKQLEARMKRLSIENVSQDGRWEHWKVGFETAINHFPFGSGLGTYGYATLPNQSEPTAYWFREAHNEYLEIFAESGLFGLVLLIGAMAWFARRGLRLVWTSRRGDHVAMGICGLMILVAAAVQSITDFVITIPANALLYASFFGVVGSVPLTDAFRRPSVTRAKVPAWSIAWALLILVMLTHCISYARLERQGDYALAQTPVGDLRDAVPSDVLADRLGILDKAIELQPDRATLYRHRAMYHLAQYRNSVIETAKQAGETIAWGNTQPEAIYAILQTLPPASRQATVDSLVSTDAMRQYLGLALADLAAGLHHNPLFGQLHLTAAALSPITRWDAEPFIARSLKLSQSDPEKLYACGLLAWLSGDRDLMVEAWRSCLMVSRAYEQPIVDRALQKLTPREIAVEMAPPSSPDMLITLVRTVLSPRKGSDAVRNENGKKIATDVAEIVLTDLVGTADRRHVVAASIYEIADMKDLAAEQWLRAVDSSPTNISFRYQAAKALRSLGKLEEALHQVVLGSSLTADPAPFQQLAIQIRADIAKTTK